MILLQLLILFSPALSFSQIGNWVELPNAPVVTRFNDIQFLNENKGWAVNGWGQIYHSPDGGETWEMQFEQTNSHFRSVGFFDELNGWVGNVGEGEFGATDSTNLYYTEDGGMSWSPFNDFSGPSPNGLCGIQVISDSVLYAVGRVRGPGFFVKTSDKGANWTSYNFSQYVSVAGLIDLHFFSPDTGFIVGLTDADHNQSRGIVLKTTDGGETWMPVHISSRLGEWAWKIHFPSKNVGYVSLQRNYESPIYFLKTVDGGATWDEMLFMNDYYFIQGIGFIDENLGWMGGNSSYPTFVTTDGGHNWSSADFGSRVNRLDFINNNIGFACGETIYKYTSNLGTFVKNELAKFPENPVINYPNPFNPSTTISVYVPETGILKVSIIDLLGKEIITLHNAWVNEGESSRKIVWNGLDNNKSQVPGGVYFCVIQNGHSIVNHKMLMLK